MGTNKVQGVICETLIRLIGENLNTCDTLAL